MPAFRLRRSGGCVVRPLVHPALARVWRDATTVQFGLDPSHAVVLGGVGMIETALLHSIDGAHDERALRELALGAGGDPESAERLVECLRSAGVLIDGDEALPDDAAGALAPDQATLGLLSGQPDGGASALANRRRSHVEVCGAGRVGAVAARLLAAAGVGTVTVEDDARVTPADLAPGGLGSPDLGRSREKPLEASLPGDVGDDPPSTPDLVVISPSRGTGRDSALALLRRGVAHLFARVVEVTGTVGPLVLPGRSSCQRCHDLHRSERDPAWPRVLAQADDQPPGVAACDVTLATQVAALAAQQVLAHLDGFEPATLDGTIEIRLPYGLARRRGWRPHPACGCMWPA
jgi:hypothetical protein